MNEELKKEAEARVKKFYNQITDGGTIDEVGLDYKKAKEFAILECKSIIKELELIDRNPEYVTFDAKDEFGIRQNTNDRINHYQSLIKQIEQY